MKYVIVGLLLALAACGTESDTPVETTYKGRLSACMLADGSWDTDYPALLITRSDSHKAFFGVGDVKGTDTWLVVSEGKITRKSGHVRVTGTFDPIGVNQERFDVHLGEHEDGMLEGQVQFFMGEDDTQIEICQVYFKPEY